MPEGPGSWWPSHLLLLATLHSTLICILVRIAVADDEDHRVTLHVGGTFPMEAGAGGWAGGQACLPAVKMALEDINNRFDVLPGYRLHLNDSNSKCQPGLATQQLYELLYTPPVKLMLLAGCSPVTTVIAEAAPVWKLVVLSYGASSPALSNRERFPTLFRTHPSANMQNPTRIRIFERFKWTRITILQSVEEVFTSTAKDLERLCKAKGIRTERQSFYGDPSDAVRTLVRQDARIIVGLFYVTEARRVLCQAYKHNLYGRKFVWFFIGWYEDTWYIPPPEENLNCTAEQMAEAAQFHFTTESVMLSREPEPALCGMTGAQFAKRLAGALHSDPANTGGFPEAPLAYDAMWALALAFNCTRQLLPFGVHLEDFSYEDQAMADILFNCVKNTSFRGVSGRVMFSDSGDRIAKTQIEQLQDGVYKLMGFFDNDKQELIWHGEEKWHGGARGPPSDATIKRARILTVSDQLYFMVCLLALVGLTVSLGCFVFNVKYAFRGAIIQSQPQCNNILLAGSALCCSSLLLMGLPADSLQIPSGFFTLLCHARISILMIGFTFAYGAMFSKVWIVHRIGARENQQIASRKNEEYKPLLTNYSEKEEGTPWENIRALITTMVGRQAYQAGVLRKNSTPSYGSLLAQRSNHLNQPIAAVKFYAVIFAFFVLDVLILLAWIVIDPLRRHLQQFPEQDQPSETDEDVRLIPTLELCQSEHQQLWTGVILGYKFLLLVFGLFLAIESRNLKLRYVNDTRYICLAIYNVSILALVTGPIATMLIRNQANANFGFISATVLLCTYISLGLIFVPKIRFVLKVPPSRDEVCPNGNGNTPLSKQEQKKYEQLCRENEALQKQIEEKEHRITLCKQRLEQLQHEKSGGSGEGGSRFLDPSSSSAGVAGGGGGERTKRTNTSATDDDEDDDEDEEPASFSSPTTLTTTALIELQPCSNGAAATGCLSETGQFDYDEMDNSSSSDEILL